MRLDDSGDVDAKWTTTTTTTTTKFTIDLNCLAARSNCI
jgi:hypothetical protein